MTPVINTSPSTENITEAQAEDRAFKKLMGMVDAGLDTVLESKWVDPSEVPNDRYFRDAWAFDGNKISVDMPKAREIHKNYLRELRAPKLAKLDLLYMLADEQGDLVKKKEIAAQKQLFRDVTDDPAIESSQTPEELKAFIPKILK